MVCRSHLPRGEDLQVLDGGLPDRIGRGDFAAEQLAQPRARGKSKSRWIEGLRRSASISRVLSPLRARLVAR